MQLTAESRSARWQILLSTWLLGALLVVLHTLAVRDYLELLGSRGRGGGREIGTPLQQVIPAGYADAQMWVRHAIDGQTTGFLRVRHTQVDNAPIGREVHWSSSVNWLLRIAQRVQEFLTKDVGARALERSLPWLNAPLLIGLMMVLSGWAAIRSGAGAGVVVACGMLGHARFYDGFLPAHVDHHGLINAALLGLLLGLMGMGAGWWKTERAGRFTVLPSSSGQARQGAFLSGICGAIGLWLSAATLVPMLAIAGAAGLGVTLWHGKTARADGAQFEPALWRLWGRIGAIVSLGFYLLEYAPANVGLRLEVNHLLYALAWWGGAELIALLGAWHLAGEGESRRRLPYGRLFALLLAVGAAPITIVTLGPSVFRVADPLIAGIWRYVAEGMSLPMVATSRGLPAVMYELVFALVLIPAIVVWRKRPRHAAIPLAMLAAVTAMTVGMAVLQTRWFQSASAAQIVLLVALFGTARAPDPGRQWRRIGVAVGFAFLLPMILQLAHERTENRRGAVRASDLVQPLYRDVAAELRRDQPAGPIVLLASPDATAGIGYFGGFSGLGTLYWENADGLRAAGEIFCAVSDEDALRLIRRRGVTHVVMISRANFIGEYFRLLHPGQPLEAGRNTFGYRLGTGLNLPRWLRPIAYEVPRELQEASPIVRLFAVDAPIAASPR